jgi:hypothetical protein
MTPNLIRIVAAACLGGALVPAQHEQEVIPRKATEARPSPSKQDPVKSKASSARRHALVLALVEKLSDGDLSDAERSKCKRELIELLGSVNVEKDALLHARPIVSRLRRNGGDEVAVVVDVEDARREDVVRKIVESKAKAGKPSVRWHVDKKNNVARVVETESVERPRFLSVKPAEVEGDVIVEVDTAIVQDPKKNKKVRKVDLGDRAERLRARLGKVSKAGGILDKVATGSDGRVILQYRSAEDARRAAETAVKAHADALRAHEEAIKAHERARKAHGNRIFQVHKGDGSEVEAEVLYFDEYHQDPDRAKNKAKAKNKLKNKAKAKNKIKNKAKAKNKAKNKAKADNNAFFTFDVDTGAAGKAKVENRFFTIERDGDAKIDVEGIEEHIAKAMKDFKGHAAVEFDVIVHDEHGKPAKAKAHAIVGEQPQVDVWVQSKDKPSKGGLFVFEEGDGDHKAVYEWVERAVHGEHDVHEGHAHAEHEEECEECEECEEECEEIEEEVEELAEMIEEMRAEMRELREMMQEIRQMLRGRESNDAPQERWRRVSGRRGEFVGPSRVRYLRERRDR